MLSYNSELEGLFNYERNGIARLESKGKFNSTIARFENYGEGSSRLWLAKIVNNRRSFFFLSLAVIPCIVMAIAHAPKWISYPWLVVFFSIMGFFLLRSIYWSSRIQRQLAANRREGRASKQ
jgi:hypothetical protein